MQGGIAQVFVAIAKAIAFVDMAGKRLHHPHTGQVAATAGAEQRVEDTDLGPDLARVDRDIAEQRQFLADLIDSLHLRRRPHRQAAAAVAQKVGRLKLNERLTDSPMTPVLEVELMRSAVVGKLVIEGEAALGRIESLVEIFRQGDDPVEYAEGERAAHGQAARDGAASQPRADDQCCARLSDSFVFPSTALARLPARCVVRQWRLVAICEGRIDGGPIAQLPMRARYHWLTAKRSSIIQTSPSHMGMCTHPGEALARILQRVVLPIPIET